MNKKIYSSTKKNALDQLVRASLLFFVSGLLDEYLSATAVRLHFSY